VLGLVGFVLTFITGIAVLKPQAERIATDLATAGMTASAAREISRMFTRMRIDYAVITVVVADMALKPTGDDLFTLLLMAAALAVVVALVLRSERALVADTA
jgi:hypothetical protein